MKKTLSIIATFLVVSVMLSVFTVQIGALFHKPPTLEWDRTYGGTKYDSAFSVVQTSDGGYAVAGETESLGTGSRDSWLVKTDASGNAQWNKTYGGTGTDNAYSVVQTKDGGYAMAGLTGSFGAGMSDFWLVKTDANGDAQWIKTYGGPGDDSCRCVVQTGDGGYALAGYTTSFGAGSYDFWLVKTDAYGTIQWNKTYGGGNSDSAFCVVQTSDGGYAVAGTTFSFGVGDHGFWLVKTDANGNMQWNRIYGGTKDDWALSMIQTSDEGYALAGPTGSYGAGSHDFWLVKADAMGNAQWNMTYGGANDEEAWSVIEMGCGGYAVAGHTTSFGAVENDFWLVRVDANGSMEWNTTYGGANDDRACSLVKTSDGGYALAGFTESYGAGNRDFWLIKLTPPARLVDFFLHGCASLDNNSPTAVTAKYKDSPSIKFSGGNPWKEIGVWTAAASLTDGRLEALSGLDVWLGLKNSDDQGTNFDLRAEVYKDGVLVASGETYLIKGVTRNPDKAMKVIVSFGSFSPVDFDGISDTLSLKILTRIGTDGNGNFGGGHSSAVGLRLYFDAVIRPAMLAVIIA